MESSVKIRTLTAPPTPLAEFDPGAYLGGLEFYETGQAATDSDRDELAQFVHFLAFIALEARSSRWPASVVPRGTLAFRALETHFSQLDGWHDLAGDPAGVLYRALASFLMHYFPPHPPEGE